MKPSLSSNPLRSLVTVCVWLSAAASLVLGQGAATSCAPSAEVKEGGQQLAKLGDEDLPYKQRRERQTALLQALLKKYPNDFHVQRWYQNERRSDLLTDKEALLAEYRALLEKNPNDPGASYLYARSLVGRKTKDALAELEKLLERAPDFPWTYLELAEIYNYPNFRDATKSKAYLKQWSAKCPSAMEGFWLVSRSGDKELMAEAAQRLRTRLETSTSNDDLGDWQNLWTITFKFKPAPEHPQVRQQIADDLKKLRTKKLNTKQWFQVLQAGYKIVDDKENKRWAEDEVVRLFPKSTIARDMVQARYYDEHPFPGPAASAEKLQAFHQSDAQIAAEWLKQWPDDEDTWQMSFYSLSELEESSNAALAAAFDGYTKAHEKNGGSSFSNSPSEISFASTFLKRGIRLEQLPALIQKGLADTERNEKRKGSDDRYPREEGEEDGNLKYVHWEGWPLLAEAYGKLKHPDKAREMLTLMADALKKEKPGDKAKEQAKTSYATRQATYWQATAKIAEAEQRKLDALTAYQTALAFRPNSATPKLGRKDELNDNAQRLWKELGGTEQGWKAYLARNEVSRNAAEAANTATWNTKNTVLPDFDLTDLQGRKWKLADLKGKVAFINLWATWCGPCRLELPYVQKLSEQMKDRKDVLVLTLSIDEEVGLIEPYMKENKYNFTVIPAQSYAEGLGVSSIPRNWVVSVDGKLSLEGIGFGGEGEEWMKKATEMIQKVKDGK